LAGKKRLRGGNREPSLKKKGKGHRGGGKKARTNTKEERSKEIGWGRVKKKTDSTGRRRELRLTKETVLKEEKGTRTDEVKKFFLAQDRRPEDIRSEKSNGRESRGKEKRGMTGDKGRRGGGKKKKGQRNEILT